MIIGVTGTRLGPRPAQSATILRVMQIMAPTRLVHGGAGGVDTIAHNIFRSLYHDTLIEIHPGSKPGVTVTMPAGNCEIWPADDSLRRNGTIVERSHVLLAVPSTDQERQSGTWFTVNRARALGRPVMIVRQSGELVLDPQTL